MNEQKNNGKGIFYGVIGVATLVVAIIGATFAYFTATASVNDAINGNMATITFNLAVEKVTTADNVKGGMIPMSNSMVEAAVNGTEAALTGNTHKSDNVKYTTEEIAAIKQKDPGSTLTTDDYKDPAICVDDNGNAVCQIYKISVMNGGTAGMYLDGYVTLTGGSGIPTDVILNTQGDDVRELSNVEVGSETTMRWAQVFCKGSDNHLTGCTTAGVTTTRTTSTGTGLNSPWNAIYKKEAAVTATSGYNKEQIVKTGTTVSTTGVIRGNNYDIIDRNYIRISDHSTLATTYNRTTDVTSALVFSQFIEPKSGAGTTIDANDDMNGVDGSVAYTDAQVFYIVVWLGETGTNQTAGSTGPGAYTNPESATNESVAKGSQFFKGNVTFISAQGSEVTATFTGYTAVEATDTGV